MAKSLRSKSKLRAKTIKRKGEFAHLNEERNKRLAKKLEDETKKQDEAKAAATEVSEAPMEVDGAEKKKVSTSGWRDSHSQIYKRTHKKKRHNSKTHF